MYLVMIFGILVSLLLIGMYNTKVNNILVYLVTLGTLTIFGVTAILYLGLFKILNMIVSLFRSNIFSCISQKVKNIDLKYKSQSNSRKYN